MVIQLSAAAVEKFNSLSRQSFPPYPWPGRFEMGVAVREPFTYPDGSEAIGLGGVRLYITPKAEVPVESTTWGKIKALYQTAP